MGCWTIRKQLCNGEGEMTDKPKLLSCPFCGGTDLDPRMALDHKGNVNAGCYDCGAIGPDCNSIEEAIAAWNKRAPK